jgi:hypothetical protein
VKVVEHHVAARFIRGGNDGPSQPIPLLDKGLGDVHRLLVIAHGDTPSGAETLHTLELREDPWLTIDHRPGRTVPFFDDVGESDFELAIPTDRHAET